MSIKKEMELLRKDLAKHAELYYVQGATVISDEAYDALFVKLREMEEKYPEYADDPTSVTKTVGASLGSAGEVTHCVPMLSLRTEVDTSVKPIIEMQRRVVKQIRKTGTDPLLVQPNGSIHYIAEYKYDGLAVSLMYENGQLVQAATRGDHIRGRDITAAAMVIDDIPKTLEGLEGTYLEVRGEVYMKKSVFKEINELRAMGGVAPFANTRNAASGSLLHSDIRVTKERKLNFVAYQIVSFGPKVDKYPFIKTEVDVLSILHQMGFEVAEVLGVFYSSETAYGIYTQATVARPLLDYDIDGVVYKVLLPKIQRLIGDNGREPYWAIAHKFPPEEVLATILSIDVQVGKSGRLTPMARITPVTVGGTVVSNVNLFNEAKVREKDLHEGDSVYVARGGDVVPTITRKEKDWNLTDLPDFTMPDKCPVCRSPVAKEEGEAAHRCTGGRACWAQWLGRLEHFSSKAAANIEGLGPVTYLLLAKKNKMRSFSDIYKLTEEDIGSDKNSLKILNNIGRRRWMSFDRFIYALGIPSVGKEASKVLSRHFTDIETFCSATKEELESIPELGTAIATNLANYLSVKENVDEIRELIKAGITFTPS